MSVIKSFSIKKEDSEIYDKFKDLMWRDKKSESELIVQAVKEYYENHKDGNEQTTLDNPIICTPALFRDSKTIQEYFKNCMDKEFNNHKFKLQEWNFAFKQRFGQYP